jgi:hypothetical protein
MDFSFWIFFSTLFVPCFQENWERSHSSDSMNRPLLNTIVHFFTLLSPSRLVKAIPRDDNDFCYLITLIFLTDGLLLFRLLLFRPRLQHKGRKSLICWLILFSRPEKLKSYKNQFHRFLKVSNSSSY